MTLDRRSSPLALLSALRLVGGGAFVMPRVGVKQLGLHDDVESAYLMRLFAARNIAMTLGLLASDGRARRLWWQVGIACDVLDAGAGLLALREGKPRQSAVVDTSISLLAASFGVAGLLADGGLR
ncbi:MAG TPA: hypothetical protein VF715_04825 [Thermoleophilaceae bacterium]|jgi:hypothetical protein